VASGEPLAAVASGLEELLACCARVQRFSRAILVDDVERVVRNLQSYDSISDCQRTVVLADESQHQYVSVLSERACEVWYLSAEEVLVGGTMARSAGLFRRLLGKVSNIRDLDVSLSPCVDDRLDEAAADLPGGARTVPAENESQIVRDLFVTLFSVLMLCAEYLGSEEDAFAKDIDTRLSQAETPLHRAEAWLSPETTTQVRVGLDKLRTAAAVLSKEPITSKGRALLASLVAADPTAQPSAVVTRSEAGRDKVRKWLTERGHSALVYQVSEVPADREFEELVVVAWPSGRRFDRLMRLYATQRLQVLAYSFERMWLRDYRQQYLRSRPPILTASRKSKLVGLPSTFDPEGDAAAAAQESPSEAVPFDLPEERFLIRRKSAAGSSALCDGLEESTDAYYVDFVGSTFAYVTEGHELPVVNDYVTDDNPPASSVPYRSIEDLSVGDFVLFRESGDSDIIRFIVEDEIGTKKYQELRSTATRWRMALRQLGADAKTVWGRLREYGLSRQLLTVRSWLTNEQMIGPKDPGDLLLIARATGVGELFNTLREVEQAIEQLKSLHIRAGFRLTRLLLRELPKRVEVLSIGENKLDLGFGKVWIVRVEDIDEATTQCSRSLVNRLLWDDEMPQRCLPRLK
jgi:hypothetical protein